MLEMFPSRTNANAPGAAERRGRSTAYREGYEGAQMRVADSMYTAPEDAEIWVGKHRARGDRDEFIAGFQAFFDEHPPVRRPTAVIPGQKMQWLFIDPLKADAVGAERVVTVVELLPRNDVLIADSSGVRHRVHLGALGFAHDQPED